MCCRRRRSGHRRVRWPGHGQGDPRPGHWSPDPAPRPPRPRHCRTRETVYAAAAAAYADRQPRAMQEKVEILESVGQMVLAAHRTAVGSGLAAVTSRPLPSTRRIVQMRSRGCTKMIWQGESLDVVRFRGIDHCKIGGEAGLCDDVEGIGKHPSICSISVQVRRSPFQLRAVLDRNRRDGHRMPRPVATDRAARSCRPPSPAPSRSLAW